MFKKFTKIYAIHIPTLLIQFHTFGCLCIKILSLIILSKTPDRKTVAVLNGVGDQYINK